MPINLLVTGPKIGNGNRLSERGRWSTTPESTHAAQRNENNENNVHIFRLYGLYYSTEFRLVKIRVTGQDYYEPRGRKIRLWALNQLLSNKRDDQHGNIGIMRCVLEHRNPRLNIAVECVSPPWKAQDVLVTQIMQNANDPIRAVPNYIPTRIVVVLDRRKRADKSVESGRSHIYFGYMYDAHQTGRVREKINDPVCEDPGVRVEPDLKNLYIRRGVVCRMNDYSPVRAPWTAAMVTLSIECDSKLQGRHRDVSTSLMNFY